MPVRFGGVAYLCMYQNFRHRLVTAFRRSFRANIIILAIITIAAVWAASVAVFAEKERTIYVFPSSVSSQGWMAPEHALSQDLSQAASFADFGTGNSAYVMFRNGAAYDPLFAPADVFPGSSNDSSRQEESSTTPAEASPSAPLPPPAQGSQESSSSERTTETSIPTTNDNTRSSANAPETPQEIVPSAVESEPSALKRMERTVLGWVTLGTLYATTSDGTDQGMSTGPDEAVSGLPSSNETSTPAMLTPSQDIATTSRSTTTVPEATTSEAHSPAYVSGSENEASTCRTLGIECHVLELSGFGVAGDITDRPITKTTLMISWAATGGKDVSSNDRLIVRTYHDHVWQLAGTIDLGAEISNERRNGYLSFDVPSVTRWADLVTAKVAIEYVRESKADAQVLVDGAWFSIAYQGDDIGLSGSTESASAQPNVVTSLSSADKASRLLRRTTLTDTDGEKIVFTHDAENVHSTLTLKSDETVYPALGEMTQNVMIANDGDAPQEVNLQYHIPDGAELTDLSRWTYSMPYQSSVVTYQTAGYFCDRGWSATTTPDGSYLCSSTSEVHACDDFNVDRTNCLVEDNRVGTVGETQYRDGWATLPTADGSYNADDGIIAKAIEALLPPKGSDKLPSSNRHIIHAASSVTLEPGQVIYLRASFSVPLNSSGDVFLEARGDSDLYGIIKGEWNGSWNHRIPISFSMGASASSTTVVVPIDLSGAPDAFWGKVATSGEDVRFVGRDGSELPSEIIGWDRETHRGTAWVRVLNDALATTTIDLYYDNPGTGLLRAHDAVFRTSNLVPRYAILGNESQIDMSLSIIALGNDVRVQVGDREPSALIDGEHLIVSGVRSGETILSDGPITASVDAVGGTGTIIPYAFASERFVVPKLSEGSQLSFSGSTEEATVSSDAKDILDIIPGHIASTPTDKTNTLAYESADPFLLSYAKEDGTRITVIPPTKGPIYALMHSRFAIGAGEDDTAFTLRCERGVTRSIEGRLKGHTWAEQICTEGDAAGTEALRLSGITHPVGVVLEGVPGKGPIAPIPESEFDRLFVVPQDAETLIAVCDPHDGPVVLELADPKGAVYATSTCEGRGEYPGKAIFETTDQAISAGSELRAAQARGRFGAYMTTKGHLAGTQEIRMLNLWGAIQSRGTGNIVGAPHFGDEEFVLPGEHRQIDVRDDGAPKEHVNELLDTKRDFSSHERPQFHFQYLPRSIGLVRSARGLLGIRQFTVTKVELVHRDLGKADAPLSITYGDNDTWSVEIGDLGPEFRPGKYTLRAVIDEGGATYTDEFDFYWGLLAVNYQESVFTTGEKIRIQMAALSDNGNTLCDAALKLWIAPPGVAETEVPAAASGKCDGNNVIDVPDYEASYTTSATGTYALHLVRLDDNGNILSELHDSFDVRESVPYVIEREGPTRINPTAHYTMKIRVRALQDFSGSIIEKMPGDFIVIDRGNADLKRDGDLITATWDATLHAGDVVDYSYVFDAPDISPYLFLLGPIEMRGGTDAEHFTEARQWQIASDAAGKMLVYWDNQNFIPAGWTCISCASGDLFYGKFAMGSSTYGGTSGTATHTPTALATVYTTSATGVGPITTNNTTNAPLSHSHTLTPGISPASNYPAYRELRVLIANSAGEPAIIPAGAIVPFDVASSSLPTNWYRYDVLDGRYPMGASTTGNIGGSNTHSHTATGTMFAAPESGLRSQGGTNGAVVAAHTHTLTPTSTNVMNNEPPYLETLFARLSATSAPANYMITMWDNTEPSGWVDLSGPGGAFEGKFLKASTTYGGTGGSFTHQHADIIGATTSVANTFSTYSANASNGQAPSTHIHNVDITNFSTESNVPPYVEVIYAKRLSGISVYTQSDYQFFANANALTPTDPWPPGGADLGEDSPIDSSSYSVASGNILRIRMNVTVTNSTSTIGKDAFKLQYVAASDCTSALNWTDVASMSSPSAPWRGYNNGSVANHTTLSTLLLSLSQRAEDYVEENPSTSTPTQIGIGEYGEYDWVVQQNGASAGTNYCFRMVRSDGTPLSSYVNYPQVLTNAAPETPMPSSPFNNEKIATTTPSFQFAAIDQESNDLDYEFQLASTSDLASPIVDRDSTVNPELFDNVNDPANKAPFTSGDTVETKITSGLSNGRTYWWRVRAKDSNGSGTWGSWSAVRSFTIDTSVTRSTWFQATRLQYQTDTLVGTEATNTDAILLITGSTTGSGYSSAINFSDGTIGSVWGQLSFVSDNTNGNVKFEVEYFDATGSWVLIPDSDLPGNAAGFGTSPVSLLTASPVTYPTIRLRANLTAVTGTPKVNNWSVSWGYNVVTPTLYTPFDNQISASSSPYLEFVTTDPNNNTLTYQVSWSTDPSFTSSTTRDSSIITGFRNINWATDTDPFNSGERIRYVFQPSENLTASTTYFWRVRARAPLGENTWSFWSQTYSFTVGTWARVAIWYQTVDGQFANDKLTSLETYGANSLRVATSTPEAMIAYGEGTSQTPKFRIWNGSSWGAQGSASSIAAPLNWVVLRSAPITGKYLLGTIGTNNDSRVQIYDNSAWGTPTMISGTLSNAKARGLDIAFESQSGRAMAVSCNGTAKPIYSIWDGTSWVATGTINVSSPNNCEWIRLASNPTSNEIIMAERDTGRLYEAQVWNGSSWGNATNLGRMSELANEGMSIEYEVSANQAVFIASNNTSNNFAWKAWNGSAWSATTTQNLTRRFEWANLRRDLSTDNMHLCGVDSSNNIFRERWTGAAWAANTNAVTANNHTSRRTDCVFENTVGRVGYIMQVYGDSTANQTRYTYWNGSAWSAVAQVSTLTDTVTDQLARTRADRILGVFFDAANLRYLVSDWNGSAWSVANIIETSPSVTTAPYGEPFMIAPKEPALKGTMIGQPVTFSDGNAPAWKRALWSDTRYGSSTIKYQVEYLDPTGAWTLIPDSAIPGNSTGASSSPLSLSSLDTNTYSTIRLKANLTCASSALCPYVNDWTVEWAEGVNLSGTAKKEDLTTDETSGTVAVAVNGTLQAGKTGTIGANGQWQIQNVTVFPNDIVTLWISGASAGARAVNVAKYTVSGDMGGFSLNGRWLTVGSASSTGTTLTLTDLSKYDNSVSANNDIFDDVSAGGDLTVCAVSGCSNAGLYVLSGTTFRPNASTAKTINTYNLRIAGGITADGNTIKAGGDWRNLGGFTANTSTVVFNATSTARVIDQTGAATTTFYAVTFGESGNTGSWSLASDLTATGTANLSYGTLSPGNASLTFQGDLTIGSSATFTKGNATTTFSGSTSKALTDNTASKQDLGRILIDGTAKTLTIGSDIRATDVTIGADDTLDAGASWNMNVIGNFRNNNTFTARTGTVTLLASTTGKVIDPGGSSFYDLTFNGAGGTWGFTPTSATATNNVTISTGTPTLPTGTLAVGGSFLNTGGSFVAGSGIVRMTSTASGKSVQANGVSFNELQFAGSGGTWSFSDTNATTTGLFAIVAGTITLPSGTLAVGMDFRNSGTFSANSGTLRMYASSGSRTITANGSSFANLQIAGAGNFSFADANATATADVAITAGSLTFPSSNFGIGGSFTNSGTFVPGLSLVLFNASSGSRSINPGNSTFYAVTINGAGNFTITGNATTTKDFSLLSAGAFTLNSSLTLAVGGAFLNQVGGATTTWSGSTLLFYSGTSYAINTKTLGGDVYGTLKTWATTQIRMWNSSAATYSMDPSGSVYSQNNNAVSGDLYIYGNYSKISGTDYWSYATDFDGTALGGSPRQVSVRFAPSATATYTGATLAIVGGATATTSIDRQSTGNYALQLNNATITAQYYQFKNLGQYGLQLLGATAVTSLRDGDYELDVNGGSMLTVASSTIDANPALQIYTVKFATSTGITSGYNVTETGTPASYWRFKQHYGNYAGENYDNDPGGNPGYIRWDDSNFVISISGTAYSDAGATPMGSPTCDNVTNVVRVKVNGQGNFAAPCNSSNGTFTVSGVTFSGDTVMTIYLDTNGGARAVTVTRSAVADLSGIKLYQNRVIVRHEDVTPISIADMKWYDGSNDSDIPFTAATSAPNTLTVKPDTEFWVWAGKTFVPGGNITLQSGGSGNAWDGKFHVDNNATFTAQGTETHSVGGGFQVDSGGTFTSANSTFIFTATTTGKLITSINPLAFYHLTFNGAGGGWALSADTQVNGTLAMNAGTLSGTANLTENGTSATGAGVIAMTGGTFQMANGGMFGGIQDWSFYNLTLAGSGTTTTKTGSSTISISNILSIFSNHVLQAGTSSAWTLSGSGTPFSLQGTLSSQTGVFRYAATGATSIIPASYWRLQLAPNGAGSPTYTLGAGSFTTESMFSIGDGSNPVTVTANTNDPAITFNGDMAINPSATFVGSDTGTLNILHDWTNSGTFTSSGGTITFAATTTGRTITPGYSPFGVVNFNSASGGWTIAGNATSSGSFSLTAANSFTQASGTVLEVKGAFSNQVGGSATTWTGTTLYLNASSSFSINAKASGGDSYDRIQSGNGTAVRMWNSDANTITTGTNASLYSQNHAGVSGSLQIWGNYQKTNGADYWSYATDFDGTALGGSPRQVNVRFAPSATATYSGTAALEVVGAAGATTSLDRVSSGNYSFNISGGSTTMSFMSIRNSDTSGLNFSGAPVVNKIDDSDFELGINGGEMITVAGVTIDANPLKTFFRDRFATSTGISSGYNVKATGATSFAWRFNLHYGNYAGEAHDSDPGGDPGYIIWDDSAANITISGNVYDDEGVTPIGAPTCDGVTQNVRLKVQGAGSYMSACNVSTGAFSISNVIFNPGDTLTLYLDTNGGARAANVSIDPSTNIPNMHLYRDRVIVRHEDTSPITIAKMDAYDQGQDSDIPFTVNLGSPNMLTLRSGTGLVIWNSKTFDPQGNITLNANASANAWDGTLHLDPSALFTGAGNTHTIGGQFLADSGATLLVGSTTMIFTATSSGKLIAASSSLAFGSLRFNGSGGGWNISGVGTSTGNVTITQGAVTLPASTLAVAGSFDNAGGSFTSTGNTLHLYATSSGNVVRMGGSSLGDLEFSGTNGGWTIADMNATTTGSVTIGAGSVNLPSGTLAVGANFQNQGGTFSPGSGTIRMTSTSGNRSIRFGGSNANNLQFAGSSTFAFLDADATTTGDLLILSGTTTFPSDAIAVGGSFDSSGAFSAGTSTLFLTATGSAKTVNSRASSFANVVIAASSGGGIIITGNATTTGNFSLLTAPFFTVSSGVTLAVGGQFTNAVGGSITTWSGSTLSLYGSQDYSINGKTTGSDGYDYLRVASSTQIRSWNSSSTAIYTGPNSSWYSQNNGATNGSLYIYGNYSKTSGTDYWNYANDFDGTVLSGGSRRQANIRFADAATSTYSNASQLQVIGDPAATTTIDRISAGSYAVTIDSSTLNASYHQWRSLGRKGLNLSGNTTLSAFGNGDFQLAVSGGTMVTIASTTIDQNASQYFSNDIFATSTGVTGGANVTRVGTTSNAITFQNESGNFAGESHDEDGIDACGSIRWTDSACLFVDQSTYRWRNDDGGEGVPAVNWYDSNWTKRERVRVVNTSTTTLSDVQVPLNVPYDSDMKSDFSDLRFTDSGGTTTIPHWVQSYVSSASSSVWVRVPSIAASSYADIYMYFGNGAANDAASGTSTFKFFDNFESGGISAYAGDTTLFAASTNFNYERTYGLAASPGNTGAQATHGIYQTGVSVSQGTSFRYYQYVDSTTSDEPCTMFAVQTPGSNSQNYATCLTPFGADKISISKNAVYNGRSAGATELATSSVTFSTGWYESDVDWFPSGRIDLTVYDPNGNFFASTTAVDASYSSGGTGFTFWGQHGGWDVYTARTYYPSKPTATFGVKQGNSGATWKTAENTVLMSQLPNQNVRLRLTIKNSGTSVTNQNFRLQVAPKGVAPNCESVSSANYSDIPTTSGGCGSGVACMTSSSQFTNQASTTQLLTVPQGYSFAQGQIMKDPSNQSGNIDVGNAQVTEVEYNFQMTAFAVQPAYCFRTTKAGVALDNYSRVAELQLLFPPSLSSWSFNGGNNIALIEGTTTRIYATGTVSDLNGYTDIVAATSTFYRSGATNGRFCTADQNNCYQVASTSCSLSNCSGNTCTLSCSAFIQYFADPTDAGSTYASQFWDAFVDVWDTTNSHATASSTEDVYTLAGLSIPANLNYGSVVVGSDTGSTDATTSVNNTGNSKLNTRIYANGQGMYATTTSSLITYDQQRYSTSTFTYTSCSSCTTLSNSPTTTPYYLNITKPTSTSPFYRDVYWGLNVPNSTAATMHVGSTTFEAIAG